MNHTLTTLIAVLALNGVASAQAPSPPPKVKAAANANVNVNVNANKNNNDRDPSADEELALAALEGLMAQRGDRALPIIKKVLAGSQTTLVKKRALFVLSQIDGAEAAQLLSQASRSPDAELRGEAIRSIGIGGNRQLLDSLKATYASGNSDVKGEVLQAWLIAGYKEPVYEVAVNAKSEDEAAEAIRLLGVMGASEELRKLGDRPNAPGGLVEAYALSGDLASLRKIVNGNSNRDVRIDAVRKIGIVGNEAARTALREIYTGTTDAEIKDAALQGMLIAGDEQGVLSLYRAAKSNEEKRVLMRTLSMIDGDAALQAIDAALEDKK